MNCFIVCFVGVQRLLAWFMYAERGLVFLDKSYIVHVAGQRLVLRWLVESKQGLRMNESHIKTKITMLVCVGLQKAAERQ